MKKLNVTFTNQSTQAEKRNTNRTELKAATGQAHKLANVC